MKNQTVNEKKRKGNSTILLENGKYKLNYYRTYPNGEFIYSFNFLVHAI